MGWFDDPLSLTLLASALIAVLAVVWVGRKGGVREEMSPPRDEMDALGAIVEPEPEEAEPETLAAEPEPVAESTTEEAELEAVEEAEAEEMATGETVVAEPERTSEPEKNAEPARELFVILHVVSKSGEPFGGGELLEAMENSGLNYGKHRIFHYYHEQETVFSVANMLEPGVFDMDNIDSFRSPGVSLFMRLPTALEGLQAFADMLAVAQGLARKLGAEVLDERRQPLSQERIAALRDQVSRFEQAACLAE